MLHLNAVEKERINNEFPQNIKLSYGKIVHKKVYESSFISVIPQGKKCFIWFTLKEDKPICYLMQKTQGNNNYFSDISIVNSSFDFSLSYGTILYGTMFHYQKKAFFSAEDIFYNQGTNVSKESWIQKLIILKNVFNKKIKQTEENNNINSIIFGLPIMDTNYDNIYEKINSLPYKIYCIIFRKNDAIFQMPIQYLEKEKEKEIPVNKCFIQQNDITTRTIKNITTNKNIINNKTNNFNKKEFVFKIRPDIQNDIYHLFCLDSSGKEYYYDIAYIPDYKTSILMNRLFRKIKENENLDALEESDDEEEFENDKEDRHVFLDREYLMTCNYHYKFKKWVPIKITSNSTIIEYKELLSIIENRNTRK
jgi:hypothetical protein